MQYWGGFNNDGSLMNPVDYREAPDRPWYQAIGPAIPLLAAAGAAGASQLFGGAGAGTGAAGGAGAAAGGDTLMGTLLASQPELASTLSGAGLYGSGAVDASLIGSLGAGASGAGGIGSAITNAASGLLSNGKLIGSVLGGAAGLLSSNNAPDEETVTRKPITDPRVDAAIWGQNGQGGLFNLLMAEATRQPGDALKGAWGVANRYFGK
jgi:hypothetical protein